MLIADRWELGPNINSGGFAHVHRARDVTNGGPDVAIKLLYSSSSEIAKRMRYTAELVAGLDHPGIVKVLEVVEYERLGATQPALVMEYVPGGRTLRHVIQQVAPMSVAEATEIIAALVAAVSHAHAGGIIHRDLKPENILEDPVSGLPRLIDFDLGKVTDTSTTVLNVQMGTPPYAAPELVNAVEATAASDFYSVGVIFHELLTGAKMDCTSDDPEWRAPSTFNPGVTRELDALVMDLMRHDPLHRPADPVVITDRLAAFA